MVDRNVVRLEAQLRLVRRIVKPGGTRFVATALSRAEVAGVLGCAGSEVDRLVAHWDLKPRLRDGALRFPVSQVRTLLAKR